jgi:uncharacterized protein (TIGR00299 family) protein
LEIHLDLVGGLAGDMFIAALLDAWPEHEARVRQAIDATRGSCGVSCALVRHADHVLHGSRFEVFAPAPAVTVAKVIRDTRQRSTAWEAIRARLRAAPIAEGVRHHALQIFQLLAAAEGRVHGVPTDSVEFHEVGAWDSVADIIGAATLIDALGATRWTHSPVPLGSGRIATAHGMLPVPAPATALLLFGMLTSDDGVPGERVTPTGAAILRHLAPPSAEEPPHRPVVRTLLASGIGFGSRTLPGLSNHVRVLCFEREAQPRLERRRLHVIEFDVDDQSGEDLATGLDRIRAHAGVLDVTQTPAFGKKGRMTTHVRVLTRAHQLDPVVAACFEETTTIGLRYQTVEGIGLPRRIEAATVDGHDLRVKVVDRAGKLSAKAESDDLLCHAEHQHRASLRRRAEAAVLSRLPDSSDA